MPHAIRLDPQGNVWTTDAASSMVYKFSNEGKLLLEIEIGGQPRPMRELLQHDRHRVRVRWAPVRCRWLSQRARPRVHRRTAGGERVGQGRHRSGEFRLPHSIQIDERGIVYVADRENGRIQRFDRSGKFLGEWTQYGKTFGLKLVGDADLAVHDPASEPRARLADKLDRGTGTARLGRVTGQSRRGGDGERRPAPRAGAGSDAAAVSRKVVDGDAEPRLASVQPSEVGRSTAPTGSRALEPTRVHLRPNWGGGAGEVVGLRPRRLRRAARPAGRGSASRRQPRRHNECRGNLIAAASPRPCESLECLKSPKGA